MSKRSREEKALYRGECLAVAREQVVVLRRIAAVLEQNATVKAVEPVVGIIHTRGPKEGQPITDAEQGL